MYPCLLRYSTDSLRSPSPERRGGQGVRTGTERARAPLAPVGQCLIACLLDRLRRLVPRNRGPPEVRLVGHVTGEYGVVAEHHVLHHRLPGPHGLEEIPQMHPGTIKVGWGECGGFGERQAPGQFWVVRPVPLLP